MINSLPSETPEVRSPEFTDPKSKPDLNRSTGLQTISGRINLATSNKNNPQLTNENDHHPLAQSKLMKLPQTSKGLYSVDKLYPEVKGIKYDEYQQIDSTNMEQFKFTSSLRQPDLPDLSKSQMKFTEKTPSTYQDHHLDANSSSFQPKKVDSQFGVVGLRMKGQSEFGVPQFDSYMPQQKREKEITSYKFSQIESIEEENHESNLESTSKDGLNQADNRPEKDDWTGFTILKRYASKDHLGSSMKKTTKLAPSSRLPQSQSTLNLAKAFFDGSGNQKKLQEEQSNASLGEELQQESSQPKQGEFKELYSRLNTFGKYPSQQTETWGSPPKNGKITLQSFLDRKYKEPSRDEAQGESEEPHLSAKPVVGRFQGSKLSANKLTNMEAAMRDSYLANLLSKITKTSSAISPRTPQNFSKNMKNDDFDVETRAEIPNSNSYRRRLPPREDQESQRIIAMLGQPLVAGHSSPGPHHETHSHKVGHPVRVPADKPSHGYRQIKVNIDSLVQRTLSDLKH